MAFTSAITDKGVEGNKRIARGTFASSGGSAGGDVQTDLATVEHFQITQIGSAVTTGAPVVNETFPLTNVGGKVTIVTDANVTGIWRAIGL